EWFVGGGVDRVAVREDDQRERARRSLRLRVLFRGCEIRGVIDRRRDVAARRRGVAAAGWCSAVVVDEGLMEDADVVRRRRAGDRGSRRWWCRRRRRRGGSSAGAALAFEDGPETERGDQRELPRFGGGGRRGRRSRALRDGGARSEDGGDLDCDGEYDCR